VYVTDLTDTCKIVLLSFCYIASPPPSLVSVDGDLCDAVSFTLASLWGVTFPTSVFFLIRTTAFPSARSALFCSLTSVILSCAESHPGISQQCPNISPFLVQHFPSNNLSHTSVHLQSICPFSGKHGDRTSFVL
jgi:hypothetical protein